MASTRNKNSQGDYNLEQNINNHNYQWNTFENSSYGSPVEQAIPNLGYMPSRMCPCTFSHNSIDIENQLFGINSTNLDSQKPNVVPQLKTLQFKNFFHTMETVMPKPLVIEDNQRPLN